MIFITRTHSGIKGKTDRLKYVTENYGRDVANVNTFLMSKLDKGECLDSHSFRRTSESRTETLSIPQPLISLAARRKVPDHLRKQPRSHTSLTFTYVLTELYGLAGQLTILLEHKIVVIGIWYWRVEIPCCLHLHGSLLRNTLHYPEDEWRKLLRKSGNELLTNAASCTRILKSSHTSEAT
jgi:hypothetical protein